MTTRRAPKSWKPPTGQGRDRRRITAASARLAAAIFIRFGQCDLFPDRDLRDECESVSLFDIRVFVTRLGHKIVDSAPDDRRAVAKAGECADIPGKWRINLDTSAPRSAQCDALMHEATEIEARRIIPTFADMLFPRERALGISFAGNTDRLRDAAHLTALAAEPMWRTAFGWDKVDPDEAWNRHMTALIVTATQWHSDYSVSEKAALGETEPVLLAGIDGIDPDEIGMFDE